MKTIEGKEFSLKDVALYTKTKFDLILYVIDEETKEGTFGMVWNTTENENKVLTGMKKIMGYKVNDERIEVNYNDGFIMTCGFDFYSDIDKTFNAQKRLRESKELSESAKKVKKLHI